MCPVLISARGKQQHTDTDKSQNQSMAHMYHAIMYNLKSLAPCLQNHIRSVLSMIHHQQGLARKSWWQPRYPVQGYQGHETWCCSETNGYITQSVTARVQSLFSQPGQFLPYSHPVRNTLNCYHTASCQIMLKQESSVHIVKLLCWQCLSTTV